MERVSVTQIKDYIAQILRDRIFDGSINDGDELTQEYIAESLGVSRMPVREAFQLLEQEGFLQRLPNRRMRVNGISKQGILNIFRIIKSIEKEISAIIIQHNIDITSISNALNNCKVALLEEDKKCYVMNEVEFHRQISFTLGDKYIEKIHQSLLEGYFTYMLRNIDYDIELSMKNLEDILISIESKEEQQLYKNFNTYYEGITQSIVEELNYE